MLNRPIAVEPQANWKLAFGCATGEKRDLHHPSCDRSRDIGSLQGDFIITDLDVGLRPASVLHPEFSLELAEQKAPRPGLLRLLFHRFVSERSPLARVDAARYWNLLGLSEDPFQLTH